MEAAIELSTNFSDREPLALLRDEVYYTVTEYLPSIHSTDCNPSTGLADRHLAMTLLTA
jgi:hypothetical protein